MSKYRKKPVVVEAVQLKDNIDSIAKIVNMSKMDISLDYKEPSNPIVKIETLEGVMVANVGDYVIKGVKGEVYPCKPDIFEMTYEKIE